MRNLILAGCLLFILACQTSDRHNATTEPVRPQAPLGISANSDSFNADFGNLMKQYYALHEGFVSENDTAIGRSARGMINATDSLTQHNLTADTGIIVTAQTYTAGIVSELKGLLGEKELEAKRRSFQMVSEQLYDLIRTVQYDREVIYHNYCPMAFNDQGANWLSNSSAIRNPYIPRKMIGCGEVKDSIDFRSKH